MKLKLDRFRHAFRAFTTTMTAAGALVTSAKGQTWTPTSAPSNMWQSVAISADSSNVTAVSLSGPHCTSTNGGMTLWTNSLPIHGYAAASSADGKTQIAVGHSHTGAYISTNTGASWNLITNLPWLDAVFSSARFDWRSVACSADANTIAMGYIGTSGPGQIFVSTNSGISWALAGAPGGFALASSADGRRLAAGVAAEGLYVSTNSGVQWTKKSAPTGFWWAIASSADGAKLAAAIATNNYAYDIGSIYTSLDGGDTWTETGAPPASWFSVASSADGSKLVAAAYGGGIYTSADGGASWVSNSAPVADWTAVASSADGNNLFAAMWGGGIWTTQLTPSARLNIAAQPSSLTLSWTVPSRTYLLQQNSHLSPENWETIPVTPVLNLTYLQNETLLPLSGSNRFYRLMSP